MTTDGEPRVVGPARFDLATPADIRFGAGRLAEVPAALATLGVTRVMVVTGSDPGRAEPIRAALADAGLATAVFAVGGEPSVQLIRDGVRAVRDTGCDGVLGFGGGSAIDVAKALAALAASGTDPMEHLEVVGAGRPLRTPSLPCIAVPTTAGTGSEVTKNSVLSAVGPTGAVKASLRSPLMLPRVAVVDPDLLAPLPRSVIAAAGSDALSQVVEPFLSARANPLTDALAREGIRRSARSLRDAVADGLAGEDADTGLRREDLALTSLLGGLCLANSGLGAVHGFAAVIGARYDAPHGAVCGALLGASMAVNLSAARRRDPGHPVIARIAEVASLLSGDEAAMPEVAAAWLADLREAVGVPGLSSYGMSTAHFPEVIAQSREASSMKANPIDLEDDELAAILRHAL
ncbi:MAG: iron-containing alcohol dehydrogenase [Dermatophilaceae bacterium]